MDDTIKESIRKYALENAVKFKGKANPGAVIGKIFGEFPETKKEGKTVAQTVNEIVSEINGMSSEEQQEAFSSYEDEFAEKKKAKQEAAANRGIFDFLNIKEEEKVVTVFPPEPSKYPHIGHAKAIILNYELAKTFNGSFSIRFEDTNPTLAKKEFYETHTENYAWLGIPTDNIIYASDYMDTYMTKIFWMIENGHAYICTSSPEVVKEARYNGDDIPCRNNSVERNKELWEEMQTAEAGSMVVCFKGDMQSKNTVMRDPTLMRIMEGSHARVGNKYRIWPTYDFENAIMDGEQGVTHRLRSKEFELRTELQNRLQELLGYTQTKLVHFARFNLKGVESSGRTIRELIEKGELMGWDDPSLTTLVALRRRGFQPTAIRDFVVSTGISKSEATLTWDDLIMHNKRLLDAEADRYFFIDDPIEVEIKDAPDQEIALKTHPSRETEERMFRTGWAFYVSKKDFDSLEDGCLYRLMDCLNFRKEGDGFVFVSTDVSDYKREGKGIFQFLPKVDGLVNVSVMMPDRKVVVGLGEKLLSSRKVGDEVQFVRYGFVRLDEKKDDGSLSFWYSHG